MSFPGVRRCHAHRRAPLHAGHRRRTFGGRAGLVLAFALALALGVGGTAAYSALYGSIPTAEAQDRVVVRGGVVRLGTHVYLHANGSHGAIGITRVALVKKCHLRVYLDRQPGDRVVAAVAEEDEAMARLGVQAGISGGIDVVDVRLYRAGRRVCANDRMFGGRSNLWISVTTLARTPRKPATPAPAQPTVPAAPAPPTSSVEPAAALG
ncbi:hypothetical protein GEV27_01170 [Aeromicrobium sp. S22]|uniref:hypothetical protein n=1 Tax=Aeromicrobium sp. S22 TaxID=2662029 RepID=UPI00129EAE6F|nr:hypothetical protein [Aeromicrobium sp. S22]MRK00122.1 hypothetical protein [Aeromicrobium sp. S22]